MHFERMTLRSRSFTAVCATLIFIKYVANGVPRQGRMCPSRKSCYPRQDRRPRRSGFCLRQYLGGITQGGYADYIVTREHFVVKIPASLDLQRAAPLLYAGVTTYSAQVADNVGPGTKVGVAGIGGLGHLAIKVAAAS